MNQSDRPFDLRTPNLSVQNIHKTTWSESWGTRPFKHHRSWERQDRRSFRGMTAESWRILVASCRLKTAIWIGFSNLSVFQKVHIYHYLPLVSIEINHSFGITHLSSTIQAAIWRFETPEIALLVHFTKPSQHLKHSGGSLTGASEFVGVRLDSKNRITRNHL